MSEVSDYRTISEHPDVAEMRERYERIAAGGQAIVIDGLVLLAGAWLAISPWIVHFNAAAPSVTINNLILGVIVTVMALGLTWSPARMYRLSWAMAAIGVWVIIAPFVTRQWTAGVIWNNTVTGAVTLLLGLAAVGMLFSTARTASRTGNRPAASERPR
ncbi:SPW repeat protein [Dactylosporangium sp. AC04546]|uniref:SPW repeat protein n=1 Tax=Dactylosporangium sp. AC04546 TaxID=2862460 RepID=UPI001EE03293|nr:SPW repeat protein [Dactylosporangium sp. AC04546]WVK88816.1 SPW repeat protein [Dactylosporangium sp. AC04546]